ncbi:hypothetical protein BY458DRAFT_517569 [Sporodiniella umbellata]|nr:hypothetical protein BY458DRAFT_517569 [Sporodiniella umbellata]
MPSFMSFCYTHPFPKFIFVLSPSLPFVYTLFCFYKREKHIHPNYVIKTNPKRSFQALA